MSDFRLYLNTARSVAAGLGFGDYLFYPPGQAAFLSFWIKLFGVNLHALAAVESVISLATISIMYAGFARYSGSAARWSSALVALYPSIVIWSATLGHETLVMFLSAILFWLLGEASVRTTWPWWMLCGLCIGLLCLVRPTYVMAPILVFLCLWLSNHTFLNSAWAAAVVLVFALAVIAPWTWRNYRHFHQFVLISTNFGITLLSSNHPLSDGIYGETMGIGEDLDPLSQDKLQRRLALLSIRADPALFAARTVKRIVYMWGGETSIPDAARDSGPGVRLALRLLVQTAWAAFVTACCVGAARYKDFALQISWTRPEAPLIWVLLWMALVFCIHSVLEPAARHHMALLPLISGLYLPLYESWLMGKPEA